MTEDERMTLVEFLLARIAEDEYVARSATRWSEGAAEWIAEVADPDEQHIARWDPARVLAECRAKRAIIAAEADHRVASAVHLHSKSELGVLGVPLGALVHARASTGRYTEPAPPSSTLRCLALPYADHDDYRQRWAL